MIARVVIAGRCPAPAGMSSDASEMWDLLDVDELIERELLIVDELPRVAAYCEQVARTRRLRAESSRSTNDVQACLRASARLIELGAGLPFTPLDRQRRIAGLAPLVAPQAEN